MVLVVSDIHVTENPSGVVQGIIKTILKLSINMEEEYNQHLRICLTLFIYW